MSLELKRERYQVKEGWAARCAALRVVAHGASPALADRNLERVVRLFLAPFERKGTLREEVQALGLAADGQVVVDEILLI